MQVSVGVLVDVHVHVGVGSGVAVGVMEGVPVGTTVGVADSVRVGVCDGDTVVVDVGVAVSVPSERSAQRTGGMVLRLKSGNRPFAVYRCITGRNFQAGPYAPGLHLQGGTPPKPPPSTLHGPPTVSKLPFLPCTTM